MGLIIIIIIQCLLATKAFPHGLSLTLNLAALMSAAVALWVSICACLSKKSSASCFFESRLSRSFSTTLTRWIWPWRFSFSSSSLWAGEEG